MAPGLTLDVVLRVPVRVVDNDGVGSRQVDAQAARARAKKEHEPVRACTNTHGKRQIYEICETGRRRE